MPTIYSVKFYAGNQAAGAQVSVYTVPTAKVAVIRSIEVGAQSPPANSCAVNLYGVAEIYSTEAINQYRTAHWDGRTVLEAGDVIAVQAILGTWTFIISGYLLDA